jgi:hypothetical protein
LYINYLCTRSNDVTLSFPTSARKRSWKSFYASLNLSPESLEAHLDSADSSPVLAPSRHLSVIRAASPSAQDSDQDADGESDGDDDDEYVPFVDSNPRKRSRSSIPLRRNMSPFPSTHHDRRSVKRARVSPSRNKQASSATSDAIREAVSAVSCRQMNFVCPECGWKQSNRRMPDFKRHMKTHTRPTEDDQSKGWWCKGVLFENVDQYQRIPPRRSAIHVFGSAEDWGMHAHLQSSRCFEATLRQRQCPMRRHSVRSDSRGVDFLGQKKIRSVSNFLLLSLRRHNLTSPLQNSVIMYHTISSLHLYCHTAEHKYMYYPAVLITHANLILKEYLWAPEGRYNKLSSS